MTNIKRTFEIKYYDDIFGENEVGRETYEARTRFEVQEYALAKCKERNLFYTASVKVK